ncbi:hypothetical protein PHJA_000686000 [Phtheirospermum japonicum]|uniref:Uncharacterized protein n=1 Tax=Phtheirospermum japonicum TaxID=374723 RepID=A0A830BMF9_9LAMI|nr:hypothetical protein PHJA_000686000 [Phtheirospermum japonicum]
MASPSTWFRYFASKLQYSISLTQKTNGGDHIMGGNRLDTILKTIFIGKLTFLHGNKGEEMAPTIGTRGGTLLVRRIPDADPTKVYVGDVVVLKDPMDSDKYLVRSHFSAGQDSPVLAMELDVDEMMKNHKD